MWYFIISLASWLLNCASSTLLYRRDWGGTENTGVIQHDGNIVDDKLVLNNWSTSTLRTITNFLVFIIVLIQVNRSVHSTTTTTKRVGNDYKSYRLDHFQSHFFSISLWRLKIDNQSKKHSIEVFLVLGARGCLGKRDGWVHGKLTWITGHVWAYWWPH